MSAGRALSADAGRGWTSAPERGSRLALRFVAWCFRRFGAAAVRPLLAPIAGYYCLFAADARRASRAYLTQLDRATGHPERRRTAADTFHHFHGFAESILDRLSFWTGAAGRFEILIHGREHMQRHIERGGGAVLIGAHLGSFDVLRVIARAADIRVNVVMFTANARRINDLLRALDPDTDLRVIQVDPHSVRSAFEIRRCVERGEFVALLGDRILPGGRGRTSSASFLGRPAYFPQGPFLLPLVLGLPVVLSLALKTGPRRYDVFLENLADGGATPPGQREAALQQRVDRFAARLEHYCALAPMQWFNYYDFWAEPPRAD